ncbi:MAG TPA: ShlB/FhaC/HecB family hemolysin secretion/activation protein, partial [Caulobacteraceae bacterium]|nr:ShlB/FhaC/HecB family hemolysin secretion/activation protein [Caulobacteraceae bacterium]
APAPSPPEAAASDDDRPLGPVLRGIVLLGRDDPASAAPAVTNPIDVSRLAKAEGAPLRRNLTPFLGRPLSRKLISDIEARIVRAFRRRGHPFVEVSAPEQELTGGLLRLRVVEFRLGKIAVAGAKTREAARIARGVRARPGQPIDAHELEQDRDWLNRNPFRAVEIALTPGAGLGETDIDLKVTATRPWRLFGGYQTSDSLATGGDRYFVGALAALPLAPGAYASWQLTASPDFWVDHRLFGQAHPEYVSQAGRLVAPTAPRQQIELTIDAVETNQTVQVFQERQSTFEASLDDRFALSNLVPLPGEVAIGVEAKRQIHDTFFGGAAVVGGSEDVFQALLAWSNTWSDGRGDSSLGVALHLSPGGVDRRNTDSALATDTNGRVTRSSYIYATMDFSRTIRLGRNFALVDEVIGQLADQALPATEQSALGGQGLVRGYLLDDGAFDDALVARQELHIPPVALGWPGAGSSVAGFAFSDLGFGRDDATRQSAFAASAGLGVSLQLGRRLHADVSANWPLVTLSHSTAGHPTLDSRLTATF